MAGAVSLWCPRPPPTLAAAQTPRPHPHWPQETRVLSKLSFPEQSACFPNLPGKGGKQHSCFPSPPGLSQPTAVHCSSYGWGGEGAGTWASLAHRHPYLTCMCVTIGRSEKNKWLRPKKPIELQGQGGRGRHRHHCGGL